MKRLGPYCLLACLAFAGWGGNSGAFGKPLSSPAAAAVHSDDRDRETDEYNRKLNKLHLKRVEGQRKLDAEFLKLLNRKKPLDILQLRQRLEEFYFKREKLEKKYQEDLQKIERERARKAG